MGERSLSQLGVNAMGMHDRQALADEKKSEKDCEWVVAE
jgi:hypothetical protein